MGESVVAQLVKKGLVRSLIDIYHLSKEQLLSLELFKDKKADNLLRAIENSKKRPLSRLLYALGIRHVGEKAAVILAQRFSNLDRLMKAKVSDLVAIHEIGQVMAESIVDFFNSKVAKQLVKDLKTAGLNTEESLLEVRKSPLNGKTVVFTGELKDFRRFEAEDLVRRFGGRVSSTVSRNTDIVVTGDNPGAKFAKAKQLGIKIIDEEEFSKLVEAS